ncbi:MAG: PQQ-binding-like beta-propeller repeat protein [Myxococcaceae bacterium]
MRRFSLLAASVAVLAGCKTIPLNEDPSVPRAMSHVSHPAVWEVAWSSPLVKLGLLEYKPQEAAGPAIDPDTERVIVTTRDGFVRALSPLDGKTEWEFKTNGKFVAPPAISRGIAYVPGGDGMLYAFRVLSGEKLWAFKAGEELASTPVVTEKVVLVSSQSETVFAVDLQTGSWIWQYRRDAPSGFTVRGVARPQLSEDRVFMGFADGYVVALNLVTGVMEWEKRITTSGGQQFLDVDSLLLVEDRLIAASYKDGLAALDPKSGDLKWVSPHGGLNSLLPRGRVVFGAGDGALTAFDSRSGRMLWSIDLSDKGPKGKGVNSGSAITMARGYVVVPTATSLAFIEPTSGKVRAMWNPGRGVTATPAGLSSPRYGNRLYVMTNLGTLFALQMVSTGG